MPNLYRVNIESVPNLYRINIESLPESRKGGKLFNSFFEASTKIRDIIWKGNYRPIFLMNVDDKNHLQNTSK